MYYVYILKNLDEEIYIGCTNNLEDRIKRHNSNRGGFTKNNNWHLITYLSFSNKRKAYDFEKYLKTGSGKAFLKKRLI